MCRLIRKRKKPSPPKIPLDIIQDEDGKYWYELNNLPDRYGPFDDQYQLSIHLREKLTQEKIIQ